MTAAAAAMYAAQAGVTVDELGSRKVIKKKATKKVGYGSQLDEQESGSLQVSPVIPGQPMPGPQYLAQARAQQQSSQQEVQLQQTQQEGGQSAGSQAQQAELDQLVAQRQAYLQAQLQAQQHASRMAAAEQAPPEQQSSRRGSDDRRASSSAAAVPASTTSATQHLTGRQASFTLKRGPAGSPLASQQGLQFERQQQEQARAHATAATQTTAAAGSRASLQTQTLLPTSPAQASLQHARQPAATPAQQGNSQLSAQGSGPSLAPASSQGQQAQIPAFSVRTNDPVKDLDAYLSSLSGPIHACQQAATTAAAQLVQQLGALLQQLQGQQLQVSR
jgi:hypothetical protein